MQDSALLADGIVVGARRWRQVLRSFGSTGPDKPSIRKATVAKSPIAGEHEGNR
jgi:hypothetical protein